MQVYVQGEFSFSTSQLHPDGKTPNPRNIKVGHHKPLQIGKFKSVRLSFSFKMYVSNAR